MIEYKKITIEELKEELETFDNDDIICINGTLLMDKDNSIIFTNEKQM